jgi:hypothetical protein
LKLEPGEADVLAAEAAAFARVLPDVSARARYAALAQAATAGEVPDELIAPLETMLELVFEKGKPRNRAVLQSIYGKTPRGRQQTVAARDVNAALKTLRGQTLENIRLSAGPSQHTLVIETDRVRLTVELDSAGARVASLETG